MIAWLTERVLGDDTRRWPANVPALLTLDLTRQTLGKVRLGDPADRLEAFGRPANPRPRRTRFFDHRPAGFSVVLDEQDRVREFTVAIGPDPLDPAVRPVSSLTLVLGARSAELRAGVRLDDVFARLGVRPKQRRSDEGAEPGEEDDDPTISAEFDVGTGTCEFEASADGAVRWVDLRRRR